MATIQVLDWNTGALEWEGPLADLLEQNADDPEVCEIFSALEPGQETLIGGGAAHAFRVRHIA